MSTATIHYHHNLPAVRPVVALAYLALIALCIIVVVLAFNGITQQSISWPAPGSQGTVAPAAGQAVPHPAPALGTVISPVGGAATPVTAPVS